eukprot:359849-Chlamydomonas_euryale.AAC.9
MRADPLRRGAAIQVPAARASHSIPPTQSRPTAAPPHAAWVLSAESDCRRPQVSRKRVTANQQKRPAFPQRPAGDIGAAHAAHARSHGDAPAMQRAIAGGWAGFAPHGGSQGGRCTAAPSQRCVLRTRGYSHHSRSGRRSNDRSALRRQAATDVAIRCTRRTGRLTPFHPTAARAGFSCHRGVTPWPKGACSSWCWHWQSPVPAPRPFLRASCIGARWQRWAPTSPAGRAPSGAPSPRHPARRTRHATTLACRPTTR